MRQAALLRRYVKYERLHETGARAWRDTCHQSYLSGWLQGEKRLNIFYNHISKPYFLIQKRIVGHKIAQKRPILQQIDNHAFIDHAH